MSDYREIEAKYYYVNKDEVRDRLRKVGAEQIHPESKFIRAIFEPTPGESSIQGDYARVRKEFDMVSMSIKSHVAHGGSMEENQEIELIIDDYEKGIDFLKALHLHQKAYQETLREAWKLGDAFVTIDTWPWLDPYVEIESSSVEDVHMTASILHLDMLESSVDSVTHLYTREYQVTPEVVNSFPMIVFEDACPWSPSAG